LLFLGLTYTDSVTGAILAATGPMFSIIAGFWFLREKVTKTEIIGLGVAIFGTGIITVPTGQLSISLEILSLVGAFFIILSRLFDSIGLVYVKKSLEDGLSPQSIAHFSFVTGFVLFSLVSLFILPIESSLQSIASAPWSAHLGVLYMALISGTLAYSLSGRALKTLHVGEASMFSYITPLWATPVAVVWLQESISVKFIVGATIIAMGVSIAEWQKRKKLSRKSRLR
jgi:drug/metabolite transporter (DMT)-like permease